MADSIQAILNDVLTFTKDKVETISKDTACTCPKCIMAARMLTQITDLQNQICDYMSTFEAATKRLTEILAQPETERETLH